MTRLYNIFLKIFKNVNVYWILLLFMITIIYDYRLLLPIYQRVSLPIFVFWNTETLWFYPRFFLTTYQTPFPLKSMYLLSQKPLGRINVSTVFVPYTKQGWCQTTLDRASVQLIGIVTNHEFPCTVTAVDCLDKQIF